MHKGGIYVSRSKKQLNISPAVKAYYELIDVLLTAAGKHSSKIQLRDNFLDETTRAAVQDTVNHYYNGKIDNIDRSIKNSYEKCIGLIDVVNDFHKKHGFTLIKKKDTMFELILDENRRKGWQKLMEKYKKADKIVPVQYIELEYSKAKKGS